MKTGKLWMAAGLAGFFAATAGAEWQRTVSAWDTRLPAQGKLQLSLWADRFAADEGGWDYAESSFMLGVNYGLLNRWSVGVAPGIAHWSIEDGDSETGIADTALQSTFRVLDEAAAGLDLAAVGQLWLPTGDDDKGLGSGSLEPVAAVAASKTLGAIIAVANAGGHLILDADDGEKDMLLFGTLEGIYPVGNLLSFNGSLSVATARFDDGDSTVDLGAGGRLVPIPQVFLSGALYVCLTDAYDWGIQAAAGYEF